ncbi:psbP domain-containing protein 2, chloroplastic [Sesamum indicum]|uniref:PsbP domain-containing protein 2, chloroplastic n=1 Tax=Sesamum indicum TaxID=4182 RepID=A0A6I9UHI4_SESIN|nr:psbP domain-containing protein 2, chloroplastic [Sesamum indicum]
MAFCGISLPSSNQHHPHFLIVQNLSSAPSSLPSKTQRPPLSSSPLNATTITTSSSSLSSFYSNGKCSGRLPDGVDRRIFNLSVVGFLLSIDEPLTRFLFFSKALASQVLELDRYTDSKEGFTFLVPSSWIKVDKAGATVLFEDSNKKANNVGVVVIPTRISSLGEFGTPQFVADKLIQAERRKESTKEAEVISVSERSGHAGLQVYEFEYKVDSTRGGLKRVFSAAFVTSKKLYLLNITHSDGLDNLLDMERRMILEQVLHSFDAVPST